MSKKLKYNGTRKHGDADITSAPRYIDENANLEAPSMQPTAEWMNSICALLPDTEFLQDLTNTASSGYVSSSNHSVPTIRPLSLVSESCSKPESSVRIKKYEFEKHSPLSVFRSRSYDVDWLSKRRCSRQNWPRLSGISRNINSLFKKADLEECGNMRANHDVRLERVLPPCSPIAKKQRIVYQDKMSAISSYETVNAYDTALNDTLPLDTSKSARSSPKIKSSPSLHSQHQSTPLRLVKKEPKPSDALPDMPHIPRCASVPANINTNRFLNMLQDPDAHSLPVVECTGAGLNFISTDTVADLVNDQHVIPNLNFLVIDCRYPYEYNGGHIKNAVNLYTNHDLLREVFRRIPAQNPSESEAPVVLGDRLDQLLDVANPNVPLPVIDGFSLNESLSGEPIVEEDSELVEDVAQLPQSGAMDRVSASAWHQSPRLEEPRSSDSEMSEKSTIRSPDKPTFVVIIHCEFSSQRAPSMTTFLRKVDRTTNRNRYPFLFFPELYVMKGGYSEFYRRFPEHCEPCSYVTMFNTHFRAELRLYSHLTKQVEAACQTCVQNPDCWPRYSPELSTFEQSSSGTHEITAPYLRRAATMQADALASPTFGYNVDRKRPTFNASKQHQHTDDAGERISSALDSTDRRINPVTSFSDPTDTDILSDRCLRLAEAVIRVGEHVASAILSTRDDERQPRSDAGQGSPPSALLPPPPPDEEDFHTPISSMAGRGRASLINFSLNTSTNNEETPIAPSRKF